MTAHIPAPHHDPNGPDGQGWNRLSLNAGPSSLGQCAFRPRSYTALWESMNRLPHYGGYGPCIRERHDCKACPIRNAEPMTLDAFTPRVLFRIRPTGGPIDEVHLMNHPEKGWASSSRLWTWAEVASVLRTGAWVLDGYHRDEDGHGFWLRCTEERPEHSDGHLVSLIEGEVAR